MRFSFKSYIDNDTIYVDSYYYGDKIGTSTFKTSFIYFKDNVVLSGIDAAVKSLEDDANNYGLVFNGKYYSPIDVDLSTIPKYAAEDIKYDEDKIKVGYSNMKIDFDIGKPLDKTMAAIFGYDLIVQEDYDIYKEKTKPNIDTVNPEKPGLATLFRQAVLTIGDIIGFLFKLVKDAIDQFIKSFIMPILTPASPYTLPLIIKNVIEIIQKIIEMVNEALTIVTDSLNWVIKKVAGKIAEIKIPIPDFKMPLFGLSLAIPAFDVLGLLKVEPFPTLPSLKIDNFTKQIAELQKANIKIPITDVKAKMANLQKVKDIGNEIDKLKKIDEQEVKDLTESLNSVNYKINELYDQKSDENKKFLDNSLDLMKTALDVLKSMTFMATYDLSKNVIDMHNDVIIKKKELLDKYLELQVKSGKGTIIDYTDLNSFNSKLKEQNIITPNYNNGFKSGVVVGNDITKINSNTNYFMNITTSLTDIYTYYKTNFISYNFTDRINIYTNTYNTLDINKEVIKEYEVGSKKIYKYAYKGDVYDLKNIAASLVDELEKEELDLEEEINKFKIETIPDYKTEIDKLNDLIDKSYVKKLKKEEQYRTPKLSDVEKEGYKKMGKDAPKEDVLVTELTVDGYRKRIIDNYNNIISLIDKIKELEEAIPKLEDIIKKTKVSGGGLKDTDEELKDLKKKKEELEKNLSKISPEAVDSSKMIDLLLKILAFPIMVIVGLLADLFGGIIEFMTNLPLLKFDKVIKFFEDLFKLPSKSGMSEKINKTIEKYGIIDESKIKPITKAVDGASETISDMSLEYTSEVTNLIPFGVNPSVDTIVPETTSQTVDFGYYNSEFWSNLNSENAKINEEFNSTVEWSKDKLVNAGNGGSNLSSIDLGGFGDITVFVINNLEGGYYNPDWHYSKAMGPSGETMFGIDRLFGGTYNTCPAGKEFWSIIDANKTQSVWTYNYKGGSLRENLTKLAATIMEPTIVKYSNKYLSPESRAIVSSSKSLSVHFSYAAWNGEGFFKWFADSMNNLVKKGITDERTLVEDGINYRNNKTRLVNKDRTEKAIRAFLS